MACQRPARRTRRAAGRKARGRWTVDLQLRWPSWPGPPRTWPAGVWVSVLPALVWLLSLADGFLWLGSLAAAVKHWAACVALLGALLSIQVRQRLHALASLALGAALVWPTLALWWPVRATPGQGTDIKVAVAFDPRDLPPDADVSALLGDGTPPGGVKPWGGAVKLLSRHRAVGPAYVTDHITAVRLQVGACPVQVVAFRLPEVWDARQRTHRNAALQALARIKHREPAVWLGRLGSGTDQRAARTLLASAGLRDTRRGNGRLPSQPAGLGPLGFDLDHVLVRGWVSVLDRGLGPAARGRPRPSLATLRVTDPRCL